MSGIGRIAMDMSKAVFTVHVIDAAGHPVIRRDIRQPGLAAFFDKTPPTEVVMEACGGAHH